MPAAFGRILDWRSVGVHDLLVRVPSAYGRDRYGVELFPDAEVLHVGGADHFDLLHHPRVERALRDWLG